MAKLLPPIDFPSQCQTPYKVCKCVLTDLSGSNIFSLPLNGKNYTWKKSMSIWQQATTASTKDQQQGNHTVIRNITGLVLSYPGGKLYGRYYVSEKKIWPKERIPTLCLPSSKEINSYPIPLLFPVHFRPQRGIRFHFPPISSRPPLRHLYMEKPFTNVEKNASTYTSQFHLGF